MDLIALEPARIAAPVDVLVVLARDGGEQARLWERVVHGVDVLRPVLGVLLDEGELLRREPRVLRENLGGHIDLAEVVEQGAEREDLEVLLRVVAMEPEHGGEDRDVDAVRECVGVVQADVRELDEVLPACDEVHEDVVGDALHCVRVEASLVLDALEGIEDVPDGVDARLFLHDIVGRQQVEARVCRGHVDGRDADLLQLADVAGRDGASPDEVAASVVVVDALGDDHALLEVFDRQAQHRASSFHA